MELLGDNDGDDHSVQPQGFSEDEDQNHSDEYGFLLGVGSDSCVSDDSDGESGSLNDNTVCYQ